MAWGGVFGREGHTAYGRIMWHGENLRMTLEILISAPGKALIAFTEHILNYVLLCVVEHIAEPWF